MTVVLLNGTTQPVSLSASISPAVTTILTNFSTPNGNPTLTSLLSVTTTNGTNPGTYTITGTGGGINRSTSFKLTVTSAKALLVSVRKDKTSYTINSTVHFQIKVTDSSTGMGVAGVKVKITLTKVNGTTIAGDTVTTDLTCL